MKATAVVIAVASIAAGVEAQDGPPQVREAGERFAIGEQRYERGEYAQALVEFERVYTLLTEAGHPNAPVTLFNIARCYVQLGREREAIARYERFLATGTGDAQTRGRAQSELRELRARVSLDGREETASSPSGVSPIGPIVTAVGGAAIIAGAITGALALAANADASAGCIDGHCPAELAPRADEAHLLANVTDGLLFGGLAVAAAGVVLILVVPSEGTLAATAGCSGEGCGLTVGGAL